MSRDGLHERLPETARAALAAADVEVAYLFGSYATATAGPTSDADVAVLTPGRPGLRERARLAVHLAESLGVPEVDVVVLEDAPLELRGRVVQEGRVIYSTNEPRRVAFETRTRSQWFDFRDTQRELTDAYLHRVAQRGL